MADQTFKNVINGELVDAVAGETYDVIDPTTGEVYAQAAMSRAEDVDRAYAAAATAFETWGDATPQDRSNALLKIADAIDARAEEINAVESKDTGKPLGLTMSEEMPYASDHFRFFAGAARILEGRSAGEYMADHTSYVRREPIGVVGQVTPWNYPLMMMIWKIAPALAAGNTVVLKPSDTTPASSTLLAELCQEFLPPGVLNVVCGDRDTGRRLVEHKTPQMVAITGLGARRHGGRRRRPPPTSSGCTSSSAARPRSSSSTTPTSRPRPRAIAEAGYFNAGQDCTAATRVLAGPGAYGDFVSALTEAAKGIKTGMPDDEDVLYGPVNNVNQLGHVSGMVDRLPDHATLNTGGRQQGEAGYFYEPTVLSGLRAGRRADPDRDLRSGHHRPEVLRRGRGARLGQRRAVRPGLQRLDQGPRPRDADVEEARLRLRVGQHAHPVHLRDAARRVQALRLRQGPLGLRLRGLHAPQARYALHRRVRGPVGLPG